MQHAQEPHSPDFLRYQRFLQLVCDCKQRDVQAAFMLWQCHSRSWSQSSKLFGRSRFVLGCWTKSWRLNITMLKKTYLDFGYESDESWDMIDP
jgi:hypothetical protein